MFSAFTNGGIFMYVILFTSVGALALFCERAFHLYLRLGLNIDKAFKRVQVRLDSDNYQQAFEEVNRFSKHPLGRTLKTGLLKAGKRDKEIEQALQESILKEIPMIKARINYLSMFANIATLLGLLGTIVGLITAFSGVSEAAAADKQQILASGISVAMFTTAFGLIVSIPCLVGFYLLNNRCDYIIDKLDEKALGLFNILSNMKRKSA
ncbi:MotA/TolQ/ExbB proton channel family protein [Teredinibacter haidensis]|uniref:MotA/TolQ/ExbB proton channel family protein n=1 Tax=Teredinibacter haidensis TaxID=2731755 RepID=UPI0009489E31|nr:MotA/TolQ/ExbB proton channel family protein [Teredinibacter haidensis]